jgi:hypothetical protein
VDVPVVRAAHVPRFALAVAAAGLLGAEAIHTAVISAHFREWWAEGVFFFALSVLEGALAAAILFTRLRAPCLVAVLLSLATIAVWAWSRTIGLPLGPEAGYPEPVARADTVATALEALTVLALVPAVVRPPRAASAPLADRPRARRSTLVATVAIVLATAYGVAAADEHSHAGQAAPTPINVAAGAGER